MRKAGINIAILMTVGFSILAHAAFSQQDSSKVKKDTSMIINPAVTDFSRKNPLTTVSWPATRVSSDKIIDSLKNLVKIDSAQKQKLKKKLIPKTQGNISAGYDYGIIPFAANITFPLGYYSSQGSIGLTALGLPLDVSYYYSSLKNIAGLNNYFRVSFDAPRYQEILKEKGLKKLEEEKARLSNLSNLQQVMEQKLAYQQFLAQQTPFQSVLNAKLTEYMDKYAAYQVPGVPDSLKGSMPSLPGNPYSDSIAMINNSLHKYDSIAGEVNKYKQEIAEIHKQISSAQNKIEFLQNPQNLIYENPYAKKAQAFISGIKKMDIGLCYPNHSTFLVNGSTLKGVNLEWEKKFYFAFTYGKTINTLLTTNNIIQNQLQTGRNLYNFFDFNNVRDSRKIISFKGGLGKKEGTHLYLGVLYGMGLPSYLSASVPGYVEKNIVLELDGKVAFNSNNSLDLIVGKSALFQNEISENPKQNPSQYIFSKFRSNAALIRYNSQFQKTRTKITLTGRLVDPFFTSYGVGFMRSDNLRYEAKIEQAMGGRVKISGFYRKDRDNLLNTSLYTTSLHTMGANLFAKVNKRMNLRLAYTPVVQEIASKDSAQHNAQRINNITNAVLTYMPRAGKITSFFTALYSYYNFTGTDGKINNYQNFNLTNSTTFNPHVKSDFMTSYFMTNSTDSLNNNTLMIATNLSLTTKRGMTLTAGVKYAYNSVMLHQPGGIIRISMPLSRYLSIEIQAERLILGDFYNSYNMTEIKKFPYYGFARVNLSW